MKNVFTLGALIGWGIFLLIQHVACFDFFNSNFWYLYVVAFLCALIHYSFLILAVKWSKSRLLMVVCGTVYVLLFGAKLVELLTWSQYQPYPVGLSLLCCCLDGAGAGIALVLYQKIKRDLI